MIENIKFSSVFKFGIILIKFPFSETTLGLDIQTQAQENHQFLQNAHNILGITAQRFFQPWIQPAILFRLSKYAKPYYDSVHVLNTLLADVIHFFYTSSNHGMILLIYIFVISALQIKKGRI